MFTIQIHTVDSPQPLVADAAAQFSTVASASSRPNSKPKLDQNPINHPAELRGVVHFFRRYSLPPPPAPHLCTTFLFIVAVPSYISPDDFFAFCGSQIGHSAQICFIRDDGMEDRYCIIVELVDQISAYRLFRNINGKQFKPSQNEVCRVYVVQSVEYMKLQEIAATPPPGFTEFPTCPVCLERLDENTSTIKKTQCDHSFGCSACSKWTYLSCEVCRLCQMQDGKPICGLCGTSKIPWVCLICGFVGCGRSEKGHAIGHAIKHWGDTKHNYSLEFETRQIWDYVGEKYVHRFNPSKGYGKSDIADLSPMSLDEECGTRTRDNDEDPGVDGALISCRVEMLVDEFYDLLVTRMEIQREHYEKLLEEARSRKVQSITTAVEKAEAAMIQEVQNKLDKLEEDSKIVAEHYKVLKENEETLLKKYKEIESRESVLLNSRNEQIRELKEEAKKWDTFTEAMEIILSLKDAERTQGGAVSLEQSSNQSDSSNNPKRSGKKRRGAKSGKKRH